MVDTSGKVLTYEQLHRDLWLRIAKIHADGCDSWRNAKLQAVEDQLLALGITEVYCAPIGYCWACQYKHDSRITTCEACPVAWSENPCHFSPRSEYTAWRCASTPELLHHAAIIIARLPWRGNDTQSGAGYSARHPENLLTPS